MKNKNHNFLLENLYSFHKAFSTKKKKFERKMNTYYLYNITFEIEHISFNSSFFFLLNRIFYIHKILYEKFSYKKK